MRQNNKIFGADSSIGEQLVNLAPLETSNTPALTDGSLRMSQVLPREIGSVAGNIVTEDVKAEEPAEIVRDMTLLANAVMRRRAAGSGDLNTQDWKSFLAADLSDRKGPTFPAVKIAMNGEESVHVVDSIERAVECLTTLWPVRNGEAFENALQICIDGIKGRVSPQQVRLAFVDAAGEAGILILP